MRITEIVHAASNGLNKVVGVVTIVGLAAFTVLTFVGVVTRYVLKVPLVFSEEISQFMFIWSCFLGATVTFKRHGHIRFTFLDRIFGFRGVKVTDIILYCAACVFFAVLFVWAISWTKIVWPTYYPVTGLSRGWLYLSVIVTSVIFEVHSIDLLITSISESNSALPSNGGK